MGFEIKSVKCIEQRKKGQEISSIRVTGPFFDKPTWIPWKQITDDSDVWHIGDEGKLIVTEWLAEKRGWL